MTDIHRENYLKDNEKLNQFENIFEIAFRKILLLKNKSTKFSDWVEISSFRI